MIFSRNKKRIKRLKKRLQKRYDSELDIIRCRIDMPDDLLDDFSSERKSENYQRVFLEEEPLVSVCIGTYNRAELLTERTIPSVLGQSYENIELIIVGDCCTDDTEDRIRDIHDPRMTFINLPERGVYPEDAHLRWMVAGTKPFNHAMSLANGMFITHLDDDDRFVEDRIEKLVKFARESRFDFVWHPFHFELEPDQWELNSARDFSYSQVSTSSILYHHWLKRIPWDVNAYRFKEPGDWNRFRKFKYLGVNSGRFPEALLYHYKERGQNNA